MALSLLGISACKGESRKEGPAAEAAAETPEDFVPFFQLSLAQWSLHRMIREGGLDPYLFAEKASDWGFKGLEYVSQLYNKELEAADFSADAMQQFIDRSNEAAEKYDLRNLLIMVDGQGNLATPDEADRIAAVENHHKWVDAAAAMGCHSIRVNLSGSSDPEVWIPNSVDGLTRLASYAKDRHINVLVENHGGLSSNAELLSRVMQEVAMDNCGTLPDFGNFCIRERDSGAGCAEEYDRYKGVKELMPFAKAVSAKSNDFDADGNEIAIDYVKMLQIVKDAGYEGFIGVGYEG